MTPLYLKARAEERLATALREYREARREWCAMNERQVLTVNRSWSFSRIAFLNAYAARTRWDTLHSLLHTPEPTWDDLRGEGYDELELRAIGGDR